MDPSTIRKLRGTLAEEKISHKRFAVLCGLSRAYVGQILSGTIPPGELAVLKIRRAVETLGLNHDVEAVRVG